MDITQNERKYLQQMYLECCLASTVKMVGVIYVNEYKNAMVQWLIFLDCKLDPIRLKSWYRRYLILLELKLKRQRQN